MKVRKRQIRYKCPFCGRERFEVWLLEYASYDLKNDLYLCTYCEKLIRTVDSDNFADLQSLEPEYST